MNSLLQMLPRHGCLPFRMDYHQIPGKLLAALILDFLLLWANLFTKWNTVNGQSASTGCIRFGQPLCCSGRNISCKSRDSPPIRPIYRFTVPSKELLGVYCKESAERIGFAGILPDFVALEGNGQKVLDGKFEKSEHFRLFEEGEVFEFGWPWEEWAGDFEHFQQNWPLVRYSLLNRHLPFRIHKKPLHTDFPHSHQKLLQGRQRVDPMFSSANGDQWRAFTVAETSPDCYCDQMCAKYGDCCANYMAQCPAVDCQLSAWSRWSECMAEDGEMACGIGIRTRHRQVLRPRENAGAECPINLEQQIGCFRQCPKGIIDERQNGRIGGVGDEYIPPDVTTVALLLDYRYNKSRQILPTLFKKGRKNRRETVETGNYVKYCVHYRIEWLNRNCVEPEWSRKLRQGQKICAECQPEAQFHRPRPRCASDLEDGQSGFWKLIGPKSCYGIWRRLRAANSDCDCVRQFPQLNPFLLV